MPIVLPFFLLLLIHAGVGHSGAPESVELPLPPRAPGAMSGSAFIVSLAGTTLTQREARIREQFEAGNIPEFQRRLRRIDATATIGGIEQTIHFYASPDYLMIGSDADHVRLPITPILGRQLANHVGGVFPTRAMVNMVHRRADYHLAPQPIAPSPEMTTLPVFVQHHQLVETQRTNAGIATGRMLTGIKKDIVTTPLIATRPTPRVAIFGWHQLNNVPIQNLSTVHGESYVDYSHGFRHIHGQAWVGGTWVPIRSLWSDPVRHVFLSDEGAFTDPYTP